MVPVMWYYPRAAIDPTLMDVVPVPAAGNTLTVREYQARWLAVFSFNQSKLNIVWTGFTLDWYAALWRDAVDQTLVSGRSSRL